MKQFPITIILNESALRLLIDLCQVEPALNDITSLFELRLSQGIYEFSFTVEQVLEIYFHIRDIRLFADDDVIKLQTEIILTFAQAYIDHTTGRCSYEN